MDNIFVGSKREKFYYLNTLLCLAKSLQSRAVTVDLRCDSYVCGTITSVDGYMNITFADAIFVNPRGNEYKYESLFLAARNIRYIHIPEDINIISNIKKEVVKKKKPKPEQPTLHSRKAKKALKQHLDTVASLEAEKK